MQDGASSHTSLICQEDLSKTCRRRFIRENEWPPNSPDLNVLDSYFWDAVKTKVYEGRRLPFKDETQLQQRIKRVWKRAINLQAIRKAIKQFRPRLQSVIDYAGGPIIAYYG